MMRAGLWTGFYLMEKDSIGLRSLQRNIGRLRKAGFVCGEMDERNAYALFVDCPSGQAKQNASILAKEHFFTQLHAPKPIEDITLQEICEDRILSACRVMNIPVIVTHPYITPLDGDEPKQESLEYLFHITENAKGYGLKIALENQIYPVDLDYYLSNIPQLGINIDFAHATATGMNVIQIIHQYAHRIYGLHVADSDGRPEDWHIMPGRGVLLWPEIIRALREIGYKGDFHLEIVHERKTDEKENDWTAVEAFSCCKEILRQA